MTHRGKNVFARFLGLVAALALFTAPLAAQQTTGKIEGTVTDPAGVPIANAQVLIVGTSFGSVTNDKGYYFFNNVPVGAYTIRAQFIGYAPAEVRGVRVTGGQTLTATIKMESSAVQVTGVTITAAANPIVPRDQVASKSIIGGDQIAALPVDDIRQIIAVQPGVVESGSGMGLSIRGGRPGEANIYIDGAPVRPGQGTTRGGSVDNAGISLGTNAIEEASVTTGALGVEFGDAQSGAISMTSRAGGSAYSGTLGYTTDEPFGDAVSVGLNRFEASIGGPVLSIKNLTFFFSGTAQGQQSRFRGKGAEDYARYVTGGIDTTATRVVDGNTESVSLPTFVQYSGQCPSGAAGTNDARNAILNNYGVECQGRRFPMDWRSDQRFSGKLQYSYGDGSRVFLAGTGNGQQGRLAPGTAILAPSLLTGFHNLSRSATFDLNHVFTKSAERSLSVNLNLSYQRDGQLVGPMTPEYESSSRSPVMGMEWGTVDFAGMTAMPFPITQRIIDNIRINSGLRVPLLDAELRNTQTTRFNPYGMETSWLEGGFDQVGTLYDEKRYSGRLTADWQMNRFNRFQFGGDVVQTQMAYWQSNLLRQSFMDAYVVDPIKYGLYVSDRIDLGDVVVDLGLRYDYYNANTQFATTPGRIFSHPRLARQFAGGTTDATLAQFLADTDCGTGANYNHTQCVWTPSVGHTALSPRLRVAFPVTEHTNFRLSYGHQVQSPDYATLLSGINNDLVFTNTNDAFGRDVTFGKTILFEFGIRHAFSQDMVLDISAYNKDKVSDLTYRVLTFEDVPSGRAGDADGVCVPNGADPDDPCDTQNLNVLTNADFGNVRGVDFKLDRRVGEYVNASVGYTFQLSRGTGSDPVSYLRTFSRQISAVTGDRVPPPQSTLPTDDDRTHNIVGSLSVTLPAGWRKGSTMGAVLGSSSMFLTFRAASGLPYTRLNPEDGTGVLAVRSNFGLVASAAEPLNASNLPWIKNVDLRLTKALRFGGQDLTVFADFRNLFNFTNIINLFAETGDIVNAKHRENSLAVEFQNLEAEARDNFRLLPNGDINLQPNCQSWVNTGRPAGVVVNCIALRRAEARFGNGDGLYSLTERETAFNAFYDAFNAPFTLYDEPRHIRIGFELNLR